MKKFFLSILTFLYLMLSTGFSIEVHYCMGSLASIDIVSNGDNTCSKCGMKEKKGGCCRDEIRFYKFDNSFKSSNFVSVPKQLSASGASAYPVCFPEVISFTNYHRVPLIKESFDPTGPPVYLRNRVFRL